MKLETKLVRGGAGAADPYRATATPLYQTATFAQPAADEAGAYDYTRTGNPTRTVLEESLALLEGGARALAFASGGGPGAARAAWVARDRRTIRIRGDGASGVGVGRR